MGDEAERGGEAWAGREGWDTKEGKGSLAGASVGQEVFLMLVSVWTSVLPPWGSPALSLGEGVTEDEALADAEAEVDCPAWAEADEAALEVALPPWEVACAVLEALPGVVS